MYTLIQIYFAGSLPTFPDYKATINDFNCKIIFKEMREEKGDRK